LEDQVAQRVEMADMAVEGAFLEAEETDSEVNLNELINAVEAASGMRIQMSDDVLDQIRTNPYKFRDNIPQLIESGLSLRIWASLIQAVERRVGESLDIQSQMTTPIDWFAAGDRLRDAFSRAWEERTERLLTDIERDLENALGRVDQVDEGLINRLLVQMSYGRKAYFDRKTHQRQSVVVARLSYVYSAARLLEGEDQASLAERVLTHLEGARAALQVGLGRAEIARHAGSRLDQLDQRTRAALQAAIGEEQFIQIDTESPINQLPEGIQGQIQRNLGEGALSQIYRDLILSVGDRLWVEYLTRMEALRTSIGLEAYGQRDPLVQYKSRAFDMFGQLLADVRAGVISRLFSMWATGRPSTASASAPRRPRDKAPMEAKATTTKKKRKRKRKRRR
jgi:preprotein translocase subunit SecA